MAGVLGRVWDRAGPESVVLFRAYAIQGDEQKYFEFEAWAAYSILKQ
jgi:hypothetical protein